MISVPALSGGAQRASVAAHAQLASLVERKALFCERVAAWIASHAAARGSSYNTAEAASEDKVASEDEAEASDDDDSADEDKYKDAEQHIRRVAHDFEREYGHWIDVGTAACEALCIAADEERVTEAPRTAEDWGAWYEELSARDALLDFALSYRATKLSSDRNLRARKQELAVLVRDGLVSGSVGFRTLCALLVTWSRGAVSKRLVYFAQALHSPALLRASQRSVKGGGNPAGLRLLLRDPRVSQAALTKAVRGALARDRARCAEVLLADARCDTVALDARFFIELAGAGRARAIKLILQDPRFDRLVRPARAHSDRDSAIVRAAEAGRAGIVALLLADARVSPHRALRAAIRNQNDEVMRTLLADPRVDPTEDGYEALCCAARWGCARICAMLLGDARVDVDAKHAALRIAAKYGHASVVSLVLADPDPHICPSSVEAGPTVDFSGSLNDCEIQGADALQLAAEYGRADVIRVLLQDPRVLLDEQYFVMQSAIVHNHAAALAALLADPRVDPSEWAVKLLAEASAFDGDGDGGTSMLSQLLAHPRVNPAARDNELVRSLARRYDATERSAALVLADPRVDPSAQHNAAVKDAAAHGKKALLELLLKDPRVDPSAGDNAALRRAVSGGHAGVVRRLLRDPRVDPSADGHAWMKEAVAKAQRDVVAIFLKDPRFDPTAHDNDLLCTAARKSYLHMLNLLLSDPRVRAASLHSALAAASSCRRIRGALLEAQASAARDAVPFQEHESPRLAAKRKRGDK